MEAGYTKAGHVEAGYTKAGHVEAGYTKAGRVEACRVISEACRSRLLERGCRNGDAGTENRKYFLY